MTPSRVSAKSKAASAKKTKERDGVLKGGETVEERKEGEGGKEKVLSAQPEQTEERENSKDLLQAGLSDVLHRVDIESSERHQTTGSHIPPKPTRSVISPPKNLRSKDSQCRGVKKISKDHGKSSETKARKRSEAPKLKKRSKSPRKASHPPKLKKREKSPRKEPSKKRSISPKLKKRSRSPLRKPSAKKRSKPPSRQGKRAISTNRFGRINSRRRARKRSLSNTSSENSDLKDKTRLKRKLSNDMRDSLAQRARFKGFAKRHFVDAADLFVSAGFSAWEKLPS